MKVRGFAFRLTGLILGIIATTVGVAAIIFSELGLHRSRLCKHCKMEGTFQ